MNRAYRLVWSAASLSPVPAPESARGRGKSRLLRSGLLAAVLAAAFPAQALDGKALPTGGQVVGGQASISQSGSTLTIQQTSTRTAIDWQSFNIGANASVIFNQPSASAIALNRVVGQDPSQILGSLSANGQVFIVNPAGVLFGRGAQVNAQGILAASRDIAAADFMAGKNVFSGSGSGQVINEGSLQAATGGYVALIGAQVRNSGSISAPRGDVRLAAADRVTVTLDDGGLTGFSVEKGTLDALSDNGGLIRAEGGRIYLTADAADSLAKAVVNNTGIIEARGVENRDGTIVLLADLGVGTTTVAGSLDASRSDGSKGGFIETSGHVVNIADGTRLKAGHWLIDPADFTIAASGGNLSGATLSSQLGSGDVTILSSNGSGGGNGDIHVNDTVSWSANTLTLTAARDININAVMTASGTSKLVMNAATGNGADSGIYGGTVKVGFNADSSFKGKVEFGHRSGTGFLTINGEGYTVINALGAEGSTSGTDLQGMQGDLSGRYALGSDIDASATSTWEGGAGFLPIGSSSTEFTGRFDGLGHTISYLKIDRPATDDVGLFGATSVASLRNVGLTGAWISGYENVGALVGWHSDGSIVASYATGYVRGNGYYDVGGL
ncbi:MAG TPA: filamentous hemagglutinin N-terminal domain-containing protein, partial [Azonexus sp.]